MIRYQHADYNLIINCLSGYSPKLERMGWKSEEDIRRVERSADRSARITEWREENWCKQHKSTVKECGCVKTQEEIEMAKKKSVEKRATVKGGDSNGPSRNDLMLKVKALGIKNFRVMNKEELSEIIGGAAKNRIEVIQIEAVKRWKSGWGSKKKEAVTV